MISPFELRVKPPRVRELQKRARVLFDELKFEWLNSHS